MNNRLIRRIMRRWTFAIAAALMILANYLVSALQVGGNTMGAISGKYSTLITPAGYAFSIWGIIYLAIAVFAWYQLDKVRENRLHSMIWRFFMVSCAANVAWIFAFQLELIGISVLIMGVLFWSLFRMQKIFYRLRPFLNTTNRYFYQVPFSLYFGWVSLAAVVNIAVLGVSMGWNLGNAEEWIAAALLVVIAGISVYMLVGLNDYVYCFAVIWGLVAIWVAQPDSSLVLNTARFAALGIAATCAVRFISDRIRVAQYGRQAS